MFTGAFVATESQLGRSKGDKTITRRLPDERAWIAEGYASQRSGSFWSESFRIRLGIWTQPASWRPLESRIRVSIARRCIGRLRCLRIRGLIDELDLMHLEGEKHYYEVKTNRDHCHMACFRCGAIMEYASSSFDKLKADIAKQSGFQIRVVRLEVGGFCKQCQKIAS